MATPAPSTIAVVNAPKCVNSPSKFTVGALPIIADAGPIIRLGVCAYTPKLVSSTSPPVARRSDWPPTHALAGMEIVSVACVALFTVTALTAGEL
jgi:hypothetical protein